MSVFDWINKRDPELPTPGRENGLFLLSIHGLEALHRQLNPQLADHDVFRSVTRSHYQADHEEIPLQLDAIFTQLESNLAAGIEKPWDFVELLSTAITEIDSLEPFAEKNGQTLFALVGVICNNAGVRSTPEKINIHEFAAALPSLDRPNAPLMIDVVSSAISPQLPTLSTEEEKKFQQQAIELYDEKVASWSPQERQRAENQIEYESNRADFIQDAYEDLAWQAHPFLPPGNYKARLHVDLEEGFTEQESKARKQNDRPARTEFVPGSYKPPVKDGPQKDEIDRD